MSRLAPTVNLGALMSGVLPTPKIRSVSLNLSPLPPPINNPHIDHKRETIIYEGRDGTRKFGSRSTPTGKDPRNLLIEVTVVLYDTVKDSGDSTWFKDEELMKYLRLQIVHSEDEKFTNAVSNSEFAPIPSEINKHKKMDGSVLSTIVSLSDNIEDFYTRQQGESQTREIVHKFNFAVSTTTPRHLTYFANVYLDVEQMINDFSLDLPPGMFAQTCSDTTVEAVYKNKSLVSTASVYYEKGTSVMYTGRPYAIGNNAYVSGEVINDRHIAADLQKMLNSFEQNSRASVANSYRRRIKKILENNSKSKILQINELLASWKDRTGGSRSALMYKTLKNKKKIYDNRIKSLPVLTRKTVSNPTIRDERTIRDLSQITVDIQDNEESIEDLSDIRSRDYNQSSEAVAQNLKNSIYFSDISVSRDNNNNARMVFFIDWQKMIMKNTKYAGLLKNTNKDINRTLRSKVSIESIRLIRERSDDENTIEQMDNRNTRDRESAVQVIADATVREGALSGTRQERSVFKKKELLVGAFKEVSYSMLTGENLRAFEATDYNISEKTSGKYRYRVQLNITDTIGQYLASRATELSQARENLKQYYNISTMKCNYDIKSERFTEFFIGALYEKYSFPSPDRMLRMTPEETNALLAEASPLSAPWMKPIAKYVEILNLFGNISDSDGRALAKKMYMKVEPSTGSPDKILEVVKQFEELETKISEILGVSLAEMGNKQNSYSKSKWVLRDRKVINYQFKTELDCKSLSNVKSRYLEYTTEPQAGLSVITNSDFSTRITQEESKYFRSRSNASNALADMNSYRLSYLSPSFLQVGGKTLNLLNRGESLFDPEQYKEMMFSLSLLKTNPAARSLTMPVLNHSTTSMQQSTAASAKNASINMQALGLLANFGISFNTASPTKKLQSNESESLEEVAEILGENTLLAIRNAVASTSAETGEDGTQITVGLNNEIAAADASLFASSLVSSLVNLGINNFSGVNSANLQTAEFSPEVKQEIEFSRTLEFFNLTSPLNGIDAKVRSNNSLISGDSDSKIRKIPNQIKSIFLTKTGEATPVKNWFTMEVDPMADPAFRPLFDLLYFNLQQIEVLVGFQVNKSKSHVLLRAPNYQLLTVNHIAKGGKLLCRLKRYRSDSLRVGQTDMMDLPVVSEHFVLNIATNSVSSTNPVIKSNLTTDGGEYKLPDGTNYIGSYHIHKDGTVMTGADMGDAEKVLTPLTSTVTTKARASQVAAQNLLGGQPTYETAVMQDLVSTHYDQISVSSEHCSTAQTIQSSGQAGPQTSATTAGTSGIMGGTY